MKESGFFERGAVQYMYLKSEMACSVSEVCIIDLRQVRPDLESVVSEPLKEEVRLFFFFFFFFNPHEGLQSRPDRAGTAMNGSLLQSTSLVKLIQARKNVAARSEHITAHA